MLLLPEDKSAQVPASDKKTNPRYTHNALEKLAGGWPQLISVSTASDEARCEGVVDVVMCRRATCGVQ